jgi:hypothetical protein
MKIERVALLGMLLALGSCVAPTPTDFEPPHHKKDAADGDSPDASVTPVASGEPPRAADTHAAVAPQPTMGPDAFTGADAFRAGMPSTRANDHHLDGLRDMTGRACFDCHGGQGTSGSILDSVLGHFAPKLLLGGTAYRGSQPAAGVEIRITDASGAMLGSTFSDSDGNFWVKSSSSFSGARVGARDASGMLTMKAQISSGNCNASDCHGPSNRIVMR